MLDDGIEILSQCVKTVENVPLWICIILLSFLIFSIISLTLSILHSDKRLIAMSIFGMISFFITNCVCWSDHFITTGRQYTEYKVTISDTVNFNEFNDKYEILGQEGKIYTIRKKQPDKENH